MLLYIYIYISKLYYLPPTLINLDVKMFIQVFATFVSTKSRHRSSKLSLLHDTSIMFRGTKISLNTVNAFNSYVQSTNKQHITVT